MTTASASGHGALLDRTAYARAPLSGEGVLVGEVPSPLELTWFEVTGYFSAIFIDPVVKPVSALVSFTARLLVGQLLFVDDAAVQLGPLFAVIHDSVLCTATPGTPSPEHHLPLSGDILTPGFRLPANQFGLDELIYDVAFTDGDGNQSLAPFAFAAPADGSPVCITGDDFDALPWQPPSQVQWSPPPPVTLSVVGNNWSQNRWAS
jgi:hypothetical protein